MRVADVSNKFTLVILLLQTLAAWNPASAGEEQAPDSDSAYFDLIIATCYTCHSASAAGDDAIPSLEGLSAAQLKELLVSYKTDRQQVTIMNRISKALTDAEIDRISALLGREER